MLPVAIRRAVQRRTIALQVWAVFFRRIQSISWVLKKKTCKLDNKIVKQIVCIQGYVPRLFKSLFCRKLFSSASYCSFFFIITDNSPISVWFCKRKSCSCTCNLFWSTSLSLISCSISLWFLHFKSNFLRQKNYCLFKNHKISKLKKYFKKCQL